MTFFLPLLAIAQEGPLDRLVGEWTSLETVQSPSGPKKLRLKGENRWVFKGKLLEIHERYTVEGEKEPGENHILVRDAGGGKLGAWWYIPDDPKPLIFDGIIEEGGMTLTRLDGRLRVVYRWDGAKAYDARLQARKAGEEAWRDLTVARYTKG